MVPLFPSCCRKVAVRSDRSGLGAREPVMNAAVSRLAPAAAKFARQIVPPVIATLIAAGLLSAYNRAFSGRPRRPRMSPSHKDLAEASTDPTVTPPVPSGAAAIYEETAPPARLWE